MDFIWHIIFVTATWIPAVLAYSFLLGRGRIMHWGVIGGSVVAGYGIFLPLMWTDNYAISLIIGLLVSCTASMLYAWLALRLPDDAFGVISIAVHLSIMTVILNWSTFTRGARGIAAIRSFPGLTSPARYAIAASAVAVAWLLFALWLNKSRLSRQLTALSEQPLQAQSMGIQRSVVYMLTFLIMGVAVWMDNFFYPQYLHLLYPTDYYFPTFIFLLMIVVAGRPGSVWGVSLATVLLVLLKESIRFIALPSDLIGPVRLIIFGIILFIAVWLRRDQLFPRPRTV